MLGIQRNYTISITTLPFMREKMKINGVEKLVSNLNDKKNYVVHIKALNLFRLESFGAI